MIETPAGYLQTKLIRFLFYFSMKPVFITLRRTLLKNTHVFTYFFLIGIWQTTAENEEHGFADKFDR